MEPDWVDDVAGVAAEVADGPVVAIGHSFGAWLALAAATHETSPIRGVVSLDQVLDLDAYVGIAGTLLDHWQQLHRLVVDAAGDVDVLADALAATGGVADAAGGRRRTAEVEALARRWSVQDPAVLASLTPDRYERWLADPSIADLPSRFDRPLLCVDGDPDAGSMVGHELATRTLERWPTCVQRRLGGLGHDLRLAQDPDRIVDVLRPFLEEVG